MHPLLPPLARPSCPTRRSSDLCPHHLPWSCRPTGQEWRQNHGVRPVFARIFGSTTRRSQGEGVAIPRILVRSEEHTSELQSRFDLVCRLQLEQYKKRCAIYVIP